MLALPFQINEREYSLFIVLEDSNIERIKAYDPGALNIKKLGPAWQHLALSEVIVGYATAEEIRRLSAISDRGEFRKALEHLSRGFQYRPEAGDNDESYQSLRAFE